MYVSIVTSQVNEFISKDKEEIKIYFYCDCDLHKTGCYFLLPYYLEYNGNILDYAQVRATLLCFFCVVLYTPFILQSNITKIQRKKKINEPLLLLTLQHWLDPKKRVCRQIRGVAPITLYLGVKFYAADPCRLVEEITRYQFFLQVKQDVLQGRLPVPHDLAVELGALALQCK